MFLDIHNHCLMYPGVPLPYYNGDSMITADQLLKKMDENLVGRSVLLPLGNVENVLDVQGNEEILQLCRMHPDRFIPFCNVDPRCGFNSWRSPIDAALAHYKKCGCRGVGEICANLPFLDPRVQHLFACAEELGLPVLFHMTPLSADTYGLIDDSGLPQLEESLKRFPKLKFFAHSQTFWAEMGEIKTMDDRLGYPQGPVTKQGRVPELMRKYPNLYGDLSAGSGLNALRRDRRNGIAFLNEFQDRLFFGTDVCWDKNSMPLAGYLLELRNSGEISEMVFKKVAEENAVRVLGL